MSRGLWGDASPREATYWVFHDESEPNKRWFLVGLLLVRTDHVDQVRRALLAVREQERYYGEVHFADLPKSFEGQYAGKARVARGWMDRYESALCDQVICSILAVDRFSKAYDHRRFAEAYHAYNRFTAMAVKAAVGTHLVRRKLERVELRMVSDEKNRKSRPDQQMVDNFEQYLPWRIERDVGQAYEQGRKYPKIRVAQLSCCNSKHEDLLQLLDVLLGATQEALVGGSSRPTKRWLGQKVVRWLTKQGTVAGKAFDAWAFPNHEGKPYRPPPLALTGYNGQLALL